MSNLTSQKQSDLVIDRIHLSLQSQVARLNDNIIRMREIRRRLAFCPSDDQKIGSDQVDYSNQIKHLDKFNIQTEILSGLNKQLEDLIVEFETLI